MSNVPNPLFISADHDSNLGKVIADRYTLVSVLGRGGMGTVYLADQTAPVKRQVALKLIKGDATAGSYIHRFEAERQALALMDHPHIARIYDGGTTEQNQPYLVMELVQGVSITEYCDQHRLPPHARLELFVLICQAVQHAHQKGIIHRDLKPVNVLVTEVDGKPVPKVIDFGLVKTTGQRLIEQSLDERALVGTPTYMSPEQSDPENLDVDTRTDVYALGVMLYELMTGNTPIDAKQLRRAGLFEMLRMVREVDPPRPSTKLSLAEALPSIAANRALEPRQLLAWVRGDVDWIVMKALEKDRNRRYETASSFAADVQRYLSGEPVLAHPPSQLYRLQKWVSRNRGKVAAAAGVLIAIVLATIGGLYSAYQRERAKLVAAESLESVREFITLVENDYLLDQEGWDDKRVRTAFMHKLQDRLDALAKYDLSEKHEANVEQARAFLALGRMKVEATGEESAEPAFAQAVQRFRRLNLLANLKLQDAVPEYQMGLATALNRLANIKLQTGRNLEANSHYLESVNIRKKLAEAHPDQLNFQRDYATVSSNLAVHFAEEGNWADSEKYYQESKQFLSQLLKRFRSLDVQMDFAMLHAERGRMYVMQAISASEDKNADLSERCINQAMTELNDALQRFKTQKVITLVSPLAVLHLPPRWMSKINEGLIKCHFELTNLHHLCGEVVEAKTHLADARKLLDESYAMLLAQAPPWLPYHSKLALWHYYQAVQTDDPGEKREHFQEARRIYANLEKVSSSYAKDRKDIERRMKDQK